MIKDKTAIVTGSTSGIGLATARALAEQGCNILLNGFGDESTIDALVEEFKQTYAINAAHSNADMSKPNEITDMVTNCTKDFGSVDILVNNAGIQHTSSIIDFPEEKWDAIIAINLSASFHTTKAVLPGMVERNYGRIINIASVHGMVGSVNKSAYVAAKHGIIGLTKVTALEHAVEDITCNAICPGWVHTPLVQKQIEDRASQEGLSESDMANKMLGEKQPSRKFVKPEQIGAMVCFLCSENGNAMTGEMLTIDGGWTAQ